VISEPERSAASITTTPSERPVARSGDESERRFGNHQALAHDALVQVEILRWIGTVETACEHGDRSRFEARRMRGGVDAPRKARDDHEIHLAEVRRDRPGELQARRRCFARAYDGDRALGGERQASAR
jgi:hypothetical protein